MEDPARRHFLVHGTFLFLLGLLNGVVIPMFTNSRMGLTAHLAGVQNGMVLLIFGLMWHHVTVAGVWKNLARWLSVSSMYAIWLGLLLAAVWGTSRSTPIAGEGYEGSETQEVVVSALVQAGSVGIIVAVVIILRGLVARRSQASRV